MIEVVRSAEAAWKPLVDPPGETGTSGAEAGVFTSSDGRLTTGLWRREPDDWSFARPYDEVALILAGRAAIELSDGRELQVGRGDVLVTPVGTKGRWRIAEEITKFYAIYEGGPEGDADAAVFGASDPIGWMVLENPPGDTNPPGEEWYTYRSPDGKFSTGFWRRVPETGRFDMGYDEIALLVEGEVGIEPDGSDAPLEVGPGDILVTPQGTAGLWEARSPVRKFWTVYHG